MPGERWRSAAPRSRAGSRACSRPSTGRSCASPSSRSTMSREHSFLVEDFLAAIASQLDRTQDVLALKAVNRPLTYAIRDFTMELKVFVEMDPGGAIRL